MIAFIIIGGIGIALIIMGVIGVGICSMGDYQEDEEDADN